MDFVVTEVFKPLRLRVDTKLSGQDLRDAQHEIEYLSATSYRNAGIVAAFFADTTDEGTEGIVEQGVSEVHANRDTIVSHAMEHFTKKNAILPVISPFSSNT